MVLLTDLILEKRGPLWKVWTSAHQEKKLSKQQALGVDVGESVDAIITQDVEHLRISGQLMLGVVRIYGRKAQYLMDDCKETRERISMAFRPGMVDLPADQIRANKNAITFTELAPNVDGMDVLDWSFHATGADLTVPRPAPLTQTNLRREYGAFNFGRPAASSIYGDSSSRQGSHDDSSHLDSQDFAGVDLGLGLDDWDMSMEIGRDAHRERSKSTQALLRTPSDVGQGNDLPDLNNDFGGDFEPMDLDIGLDDLPDLDETRARRGSSTLSTPPPESPSHLNQTLDVSPRTAKRIADAQKGKDKAKRVRIVRADEELELADEEFAAPNDDSDILGEEQFIPADSNAVRLRDIIDDPTAFFLPTSRVGSESVFFAGPPGLAPELAELFTFNVNVLRRNREEPEVDHSSKRPRIEGPEEEVDDEVGRRREQSHLPSEAGFDAGIDTFGGEDLTFDFDGPLVTPPPVEKRPRAPSIAPSRAESIAREIQFGEQGDHPLTVFDTRIRNSQGELESQSQSLASELGTPTKGGAASSIVESQSGGFSATTGMAMGVLRRELDAIEAADKAVSFDKVAAGASKRAASAFFFELLVLGTRDCVRLEQKKAFGPIEVRAKDRLWEGAEPVATA
ncbi:Electron transfer flavoprotein alpha-subunit [Vanrija albida]|uniref:Electron transfer flavoprotein alpha-subunit n=1 Tax=Vanrija albida TaxID=181172 RepID=A0ABR3Q4W8_9TREE